MTIDMSTWLPSNVARVRNAVALSERNEAIRVAYRARGDEDAGTCIARLARQHLLSESAIKAVLWPCAS